jgi:hypothetical protein
MHDLKKRIPLTITHDAICNTFVAIAWIVGFHVE